MRGPRPPASPLYPKIRFAFTDHPITVWAGGILLRLYFELIGVRAGVAPLLAPFAKRSNNQIPADSRRRRAPGLVVWARPGCRTV